MAIQNWETIESEYLFKRPWLTARKDKVRLPDGRINPEFYVLEYPDWVNVTAINEDGDFVMISQYRHGLKGVFTELVAGVIDDGEDPLQAAKRELLEEAGYGGGEWELLTILCQNPSTTTNYTYCFLAKGVKKISGQKLDPMEDIAVKIVTKQELIEMLIKDEMKQALMAAPLWKYLYLNK